MMMRKSGILDERKFFMFLFVLVFSRDMHIEMLLYSRNLFVKYLI